MRSHVCLLAVSIFCSSFNFSMYLLVFFFFFKQKTAYEIGLGIPAEPLFRSPFLISCLIWLDLVASLPLIKERILVIILLLHFLSLMLGSVLVLMLPLLVWLTPDLRIKKSLLKCNWTIRGSISTSTLP